MKLHDNPTLGVIAGGVALLALAACATVPATPVPETAADGSEARVAERPATPATPETAAYPNDAGKLAKITQTAGRGQSTAPILINYFGGIDAANTGFLVKTILAEIANGESHFQINLNSNGGDPNYSIATYNLLKNLPIHITTYNVNQVESAAVYLYCLGNRRHAHPRSIFTIHSVKWSLTAYSPAKILDISKKINLQQANIADIFKACMNIDPAEIERHLYGDADWYLEAREALQKGLVNSVTSASVKPKKVYLISDGYKG